MMSAMRRGLVPFLRSAQPARSPSSSPSLRALLLAATLAACSSGGGGSVTRARATPANRSPMVLPPAEGIGYLALSTWSGAAGDSPLYWLPAEASGGTLLLLDGTSEPKAGDEVTAVPSLGEPTRLVVGEHTRVKYGCDDNSLEGVALAPVPAKGRSFAAPASVALPPGPVWIIPDSPASASWKPSGIEVAPRELSPQKRVWAVGPLEIALTVKDRSHATFAAAAGSAWMMSREVERSMMAGAEDVAIDLTQDVPGMPSVVAAFSFMPTGPILVVVATPGYEGTQLSALVYDGLALLEVESMQRYLYACAF